MIASLVLVVATIMVVALLAASLSPSSVRPLVSPLVGRPARPHPGGNSALIDMAERTSRDVRSGLALRTALLDALAQHPELMSSLRERLARGTPLAQALAAPSPDTQTLAGDAAFFMHGLRLAAQTGGAMADTLDRVVAVIRERQVWKAERHAQAAQARLSARMLTALPMAVAGWGLVSGPRVRDAYSQSPATGVLAAIGVLLNLTGWWWMRRLVRGPLPQ